LRAIELEENTVRLDLETMEVSKAGLAQMERGRPGGGAYW
jgi:hypothetical protein